MRWVAILLVVALLCAGTATLLVYGGYEYNRVADAALPEPSVATPMGEPIVDAPAAAGQSCADGKAAFLAKDYERTTTLLAVCLDANPADVDARLQLGRAYAASGRYERADAELAAALAARPEDAAAWQALAYARTQSGNDRSAESALDKWIAWDPSAPVAWRMRAEARYRVGDSEGAGRDAAQACALGDEDGCTLQKRMKDVSRRR